MTSDRMGETNDRWLSPGEASRLLGVHPATLRVWTNKGKLPVYRTAGGHRRFDRADVMRFLEEARQAEVGGVYQAVERALVVTRDQVTHDLLRRERWFAVVTDEMRSHHRALGRELLGLTVQYVARRENGGERIVEEGRRVGREMASCNLRMGLSLSEAIRAFMYFRDSLIDSLVPALIRPGEMDSDDISIYRRAREFLNEVLSAILEIPWLRGQIEPCGGL